MVSGLFFASYNYFEGGVIGNMLSQWEQSGFFSYVIPFLLIFALVYGILTRAQIFKETKAVNAIVAIAVGLMSLQFELVPRFFAEIFPRLGVGLAVILLALIILGMFMSSKMTGVMFGLGAVVVLVVLYNTGMALGWSSAYEWSDNWVYIILLGLGIWGMVAVVNSNKPPKPDTPNDSPLARALRGQ